MNRALSLLFALALAASPAAAADRIKVDSLDDLPDHAYPISGSATALLADDAAFSVAEAFYNSDQNKVAARSYRDFLEGYPESKFVPMARYKQACVDYRSGEYNECVRKLEDLCKDLGGEPICAPANYLMGSAWMALGRTSHAIFAFTEVVKGYQDSDLASAAMQRCALHHLLPRVGVAAGVSSTIAHAAGPVLALYLLAQRLEKTSFVATTGVFFTVNNLLKVPPYAATGLIDAGTLALSLRYAAAVPFGIAAGWWANRHLPQKHFDAVVAVLMIVTSIHLLHGG